MFYNFNKNCALFSHAILLKVHGFSETTQITFRRRHILKIAVYTNIFALLIRYSTSAQSAVVPFCSLKAVFKKVEHQKQQKLTKLELKIKLWRKIRAQTQEG